MHKVIIVKFTIFNNTTLPFTLELLFKVELAKLMRYAFLFIANETLNWFLKHIAISFIFSLEIVDWKGMYYFQDSNERFLRITFLIEIECSWKIGQFIEFSS